MVNVVLQWRQNLNGQRDIMGRSVVCEQKVKFLYPILGMAKVTRPVVQLSLAMTGVQIPMGIVVNEGWDLMGKIPPVVKKENILSPI